MDLDDFDHLLSKYFTAFRAHMQPGTNRRRPYDIVLKRLEENAVSKMMKLVRIVPDSAYREYLENNGEMMPLYLEQLYKDTVLEITTRCPSHDWLDKICRNMNPELLRLSSMRRVINRVHKSLLDEVKLETAKRLKGEE